MDDSNHPNVARVRDALDAYAAGDWDAMKRHFDDEIVWHVGGDHPLSGTYTGSESVVGYFQKAKETSDGTLRLEVQEVLANDRFAGVVLRARAERQGRRLDVEMAEGIRLGDGGKWLEFWALTDDAASVDEFWR